MLSANRYLLILLHRKFLFSYFYSHYMPIHPTKAILIFLIPTHEVELIASVIAAPFNGVRQQYPAGGKLPVGATDARVVTPQFIFVIEVQRCSGFDSIHLEETKPEIALSVCSTDGDRHLLAHSWVEKICLAWILNH